MRFEACELQGITESPENGTSLEVLMLVKTRWIELLALLAVPMVTVYGQDKRGFSQPDSVLLFGTYGDLQVVTPGRVYELKPPVELGYNHGYFVNPGIDPRCDFIAWVFRCGVAKRPSAALKPFCAGNLPPEDAEVEGVW